MLTFARTIYRLKHQPQYLNALALDFSGVLGLEPPQASMLMGYDFHLSPEGPKLIEINNNAGGLWENDDGWIPQFENPDMPGNLQTRILKMFDAKWQNIIILDETIESQYMFPEMNAYAELLQQNGRQVSLISPEDLVLKADGLYANQSKVDVIYNRHTDFYLESEPMKDIKYAYLNHQVDLNPYPRSYALIGDKNRMVDWWRKDFLAFLPEETIALIKQVVPETVLLAEYDFEQAWSTRKEWVFKPAARHGGKGVLMGKSISKTRFEGLDLNTTVMQRNVPASQIMINDKSFKFDIRLYMHGEQLIALAGRAWNGQITNFREEGSGWTPIQVEK